MEETKSKWKSKTLWVNFIVGALAFFPQVSEHVSPSQVAQGLALLNIILRFFTKDKVYLIE